MSEMSYARQLVKGNVVEKTHLRQAVNEDCFGEHALQDIHAHMSDRQSVSQKDHS